MDKRPHRCHTWMVQWYSTGGACVHPSSSFLACTTRSALHNT